MSGAFGPARRFVRAAAAPTGIDDVPGWFDRIDQVLFRCLLSTDGGAEAHTVPSGNLVELGAYLGKSAILIGAYQRPGETFTVCDLFGAPAPEQENRRENDRSYPAADRAIFERNYLAFHPALPVVVQDLTSTMIDHVPPGSVRFMHVDASHLYAHVAGDVRTAHRLLAADGVVVFDDFRSEHTPGVAAAVWEAVFAKSLHPICSTPAKLYATFGDPDPAQRRVRACVADLARVECDPQEIDGHLLLRIAPSRTFRYGARLRAMPHLVKQRLDRLDGSTERC